MEAQDNTAPLWKPRKRNWPNGREYWIVSDGKGRVLTSDNLLESHFSDRAHYNFTQHLQSVIRDAMMHVTPAWNDNLQDISEKLAVTALQKMKHSITLEECEAIFSESGLRAANPTAPSR